MKKRITQFVVDGCKQGLLLFLMLCYTLGHAQNATVTGKVIDANGGPLVGVSVKVKGSQTGALSNAEGNYSINVPNQSAVLVFTFLGMKPKEALVNGRNTINITLDEDASSLDAIMVVGYGTQSKRDVTGSISSIKEKTLREVPVTNISQMIEGRIPGAYVTAGANKPGTTPSIRIRGNRSLSAGNDPLYVVDGIPVNDAITDFNPSDVVSIEVLKDASATAIYGSRGANGVILVTTARGKIGQTDVRYNAYYGITEVVRRADIFNGEEFVKFVRDANAALTPPVTDELLLFKDPIERESIALGRYTDWQDLIIKKGHTQSHELGISSGTEKTKVNLSLGYFDDEGYLIGQNYKRYTARINIDQNLGKRIKLGMSLLGSYSQVDGANYNPYAGALITSPLGQPYDNEGKFAIYPINDPAMPNPLLATQGKKFVNLENRTRLLGSFFAEAEIISGLKYRVNFGPDLRNTRGGSFNSTSVSVGVSPTASTSEGFWFSYALDNQLTYDKVFKKKHKLNVTALYGIQERVNESSNISVRDLPVETTTYHNLGSAGTIVGVGSGYTRWNILSYMGRINYAFDGRYSLTLTGRADGSSRFAPGNKWSFFPSAGFAYNISEEKFLKDVSFLSNLKLRLGYGSVGQEAVTPYQTLAQLVRTPYDFDGVSAFGFAPGNVPNKNLKWETSTTANVAVDFGFLNQRISGSIDVYQTNTTDLLLPAPLPPSTGFGSVTTNIGSTRNRGIDFSLSTQNIVSKSGFQWSTDITAAINKGEIIELALGKVDDIGAGRFIGKSINSYFDYEKIGIWQTGEQAQAALFGSRVGQIRVKDQDGDGKVTIADRIVVGSADPRFTFGFNNNFSFKGFDLAVFVVGVQNKTISSPLYDNQNTVAFGGRYNHLALDYWTPTNPTNAYPQPIAGQGPGAVLYRGTMKYFDGSFVRIRNINLGYTLSNLAVSKIGAKSLRFYLNVTNPFVFSPYVRDHKGIDPEILDNPATINYQLGLNVNF